MASEKAMEKAKELCPDIYIRNDEGTATGVAWLDARRLAIATALDAAREEALEEAAKVLEGHAESAFRKSRKDDLLADAQMLRSLKSPKTEEGV